MDSTWRPLGVETEEQVSEYDALREDITPGLETPLWEWIQRGFTRVVNASYGGGSRKQLRVDLAEHAAQALDVSMKTIRSVTYQQAISSTISAMRRVRNPWQVVDFVLAHSPGPNANELEQMLVRSRSVWAVGERQGHPGLVRRVPEAVGTQLGDLARTAGSAGAKLLDAWESVYGVSPNASHAYSMAIKAVEDAAIPVVVPQQNMATLGHVIGQMKNDGDWKLPFTRTPSSAAEQELPLSMCRTLWEGQHDRHGGAEAASGSVNQQEAEAAVSIALSLVHWFSTGMLQRR